MAQTHAAQNRTPGERWVRLYTHLAIFVLVNAGLTTLNLVRRPDNLWFYWPLGGWGLGLLLHTWIVFQHRNDAHKDAGTSSQMSDSPPGQAHE